MTKVCRWLEISRSGYDEWRDRPVSPSRPRRDRLAALIVVILDEFEQTHGYRWVDAELLDAGFHARPSSSPRFTTLPEQLRRSLTWNRGKELSQHAQFKVETGFPVLFAEPRNQ